MLVAAVLHDPELIVYNRFVEVLENEELFDKDFIAVLSKDTPAKPYEDVLTTGVHIQWGRGNPQARRQALEVGFTMYAPDLVMIVDFDRLLYWLNFCREEFYTLQQQCREPYYTVVGRTEKAMNTHPFPQRSTERAINNYVANNLFQGDRGKDLVSGTSVMSKHIAEYIWTNSHASDPGAVDVEWYCLATLGMNAPIAYYEVDGLGYEGAWAGLELCQTKELIHRRFANLDRAIAMTEIIKTWRSPK